MDRIWKCLGGCLKPIPQRVVIGTMVMLGLSFQYLNRSTLNMVITVITYDIPLEQHEAEEACPYNATEEAVVKEKSMAEFRWSSVEQGTILGSFYIGYIVTHLPGGVLSDVYGPKKVIGYGIVLTSIITIVTPWVARGGGYFALVALRFALGLSQGPLFPAIGSFIARWSLQHERSYMSSYINAGIVVGSILGSAATGFLLGRVDQWDTLFYLYGTVSLLWYVCWWLLVHDSPRHHPFITEKEKGLLVERLRSEVNETDIRLGVPYKQIFTSVPVWAMTIAGSGNDWAFYIVIVLLPQYMSYVLHVNVEENGYLNCLPYVGMVVCSFIASDVQERLIRKQWMSKTTLIKINTLLTNMVPCLMYVSATYVGCNKYVVVGLFSIAMCFLGIIYPSLRINNVDLAPNYSGTLMAMMNGLGSITGYAGPYMFALFTTTHTIRGWRTAFYVSTGIVGLSTLVFLVFGTTDIQPWNFPPDFDINGEEDGKEEEDDNETRDRQ